ncbi:hypothetical protein AaE_012551 [Aphanomyces astaci]|uniref:Reverse transcriptase Ty1/copia-type domain-containing protein n=1 Tax=Aphanomyces astaci TaxID=112090 RepID=A0A6A4ZFR6_APHAT|nr:hypothetical protein AaE_012551 [Aphanomyces astaci]
MYLAMGFRPDLAYALQQLSQLLHNPGLAHWRAAKRALHYLRGTSNLGLMLGDQDYVSKPFLSAYVDANYAILILWLSKKQGIVTLSTTEAEFVDLALCIQEFLYVRQLAAELHNTSDQPISVYEDNQSTISIAQNTEHHGRSKTIDVRFMFVRDLVENSEFILHNCSTKEQRADFFTKAHPEPVFRRFCLALRLYALGDYLCGRVP